MTIFLGTITFYLSLQATWWQGCLVTMSNFLVSQTRDIDNENNQTYRDFTEIENWDLINTHLESIAWANELRINRWAPLQKVSNRKKKTQNKPWFIKSLLKLIESKNKFYKKMFRTKDTLKRRELETKVKIYKKNILRDCTISM